MGKVIDITNQRFGKLIALRMVGKLDGKNMYWECQCDCGNVKNIMGSSLRSGNTKSCGCNKSKGLIEYNAKQSEKSKIPLGTKFGRLTVIKDIGFKEHVPGHNRKWYLCECECGNTKEVMGNQLKQGLVQSCGQCNLKSVGEEQIKKILDQKKVSYLYDVTFLPLIQETGRKLRFDFIIFEDENYKKPIRFIEFDGRQHTKGPDTDYWGKGDPLEKIQERDAIKNNFCKKYNYQLVRIPYTVKNITEEDIFSNKYLLKGGDEL